MFPIFIENSAPRWLGAVGVVFVVLSMGDYSTISHAQNPAQKAEKRITMNFDKAPWGKVFEWYADQSQMTYVSKFPAPMGTFTFASPKGKDHNMLEAMGIINQALEKEGFILAPRTATVTMVKIVKGK